MPNSARALCSSAVAVVLVLGTASLAGATRVTFVTNDAFVKDKMLSGVAIKVAHEAGGKVELLGVTDASGQLVAELPPRKYLISYSSPGYVPIENSPVEIGATEQVITTTLSMLLEAEGTPAERRVRLILNWGNNSEHVRDVDSHLVCACGQEAPHVYFGDKSHRIGPSMRNKTALTHSAELDVDDMDGGGPETITLIDPPPGKYPYWVRAYSSSGRLGESEVVVRVVIGDAVAGEYRIPRDLPSRDWAPFAGIRVDDQLHATVVPFTAGELASGADQAGPGDTADLYGTGCTSDCGGTGPLLAILFIVVIPIVLGRLSGRKRS